MILSWSIEAEINLNLRKWAENLPRLRVSHERLNFPYLLFSVFWMSSINKGKL